MEKTDVYLGAVTVLFSLVLWLFLIPNYVVVPGNIEHFYMGPNFWVTVIAASMFLLGALLLYNALKNARPTEGDPITPLQVFRLCSGMAIFVAYYLFLQSLGIIITSAIAVVACSLMYGERRLKYLLPLAILLPVMLYLFFLKIASIPMPQGILAGIGPF